MSEPIETLPQHWRVSTLGEINIVKATSINPQDFADEVFEYYSIPDYQRNQKPSLTKGGSIESSKLHLNPNTILFGKLNPRVEKVWRVGAQTGYRQIGSTEWIPILPSEIDQPEENLDNQTIYKLLVPCIKEAKRRRQIILITHNPNLAVVCDAEQIIACSIDKQGGNRITYTSGAIENPRINQSILDILEGTRPAFENRGSKYLDAPGRTR